MIRWLLLLLVGCAACAPSRFALREPPREPFDAVIIPGCPSEDDGAMSRCQLGRAGLAGIIWKRGWAKVFIPSGGAVHSPYVEAEAIAEGMTVVGVPAERIYVEGEALHTDENMYNSLRIATLLGMKRIAVASNAGHASWGCQMLEDYGLDRCTAIAMNIDELEAFMPPYEARLYAVRSRRVPEWVDMAEQEKKRALVTGRDRPASWLLYPMLGYLRWIGKPWRPIASARPAIQTWAAIVKQR
ncbi:MAG: YdcF family protein [Deltaproteobacteria bacterium]|nr:YdcF family protein [Deltaproteobacteria bacterium]